VNLASKVTSAAPLRKAFRYRLTLRLAAALAMGAAVILIGAGAWNISMQQDHLTSLLRTSAERCAEVIRSSTREAMLQNHPEEVKRIIDTIASQQPVERIRVFDKQGRISTSSLDEEVGTLVDTDAEQCYACHQRDEPLDRLEQEERMRIFRGPGSERIMGIIAPIRNEPECTNAACHAHDASQTVLGVLDVQLSLAVVDEDIAASERQMVVGLVTTALAILALVGLLAWRMVLRPVRRLTYAASLVTDGDLSARVPVSSSDEIGELSEGWNKMVSQLDLAQGELEKWGHKLEKRVEEKTEELEQAHQRMVLVEKMASLGKLAAVVAHEINNPLTGISTYARLLRRKLSNQETATAETQKGETEKVLKLIEDEAVRCGNIVKNLLLFSRTPGARFSEEEIPPLLDRCVMLVRHRAELEEIELRLNVEENLPRISCDASQIQQMILALAMNALEATPPSGYVALGAKSDIEGDGVVLEVSDNGRGIPPENLDKIFEPFFSTKEEVTQVGLGLSVVYGIINRHHGHVEVQSTPGAGTTFSIRLPRKQPASDDAPEDDQKALGKADG
jgi:two-component system NtrC family sensor kinase